MMPFGASISCAIWEKFATACHWIIQSSSRNPDILHYLDDFLFEGPPISNRWQSTLDLFKIICSHIGIPIALDKITEPSTTIIFLGIEFDTIHMVMRLPQVKLVSLRQSIQTVMISKKVLKGLTMTDWSPQFCMQNSSTWQSLLQTTS